MVRCIHRESRRNEALGLYSMGRAFFHESAFSRAYATERWWPLIKSKSKSKKREREGKSKQKEKLQ